MRLTFRPLPAWPHVDHANRRRSATFKAPYEATLRELEREIESLGGKEVVIGVVVPESEIRFDGSLKGAPSRVQGLRHSGVELSFEVKKGRLVYASDVFDDWTDNLRGIRLGLEALRAVNRYGISEGGEQYAGYLQLPSGGPDADRGLRLVESAGGLTQALMKHHPDHGGAAADFADVQAYRKRAGF